MYESKYISPNSQNKIVFGKYLNLYFYCKLCVNFSQENKLRWIEWINIWIFVDSTVRRDYILIFGLLSHIRGK